MDKIVTIVKRNLFFCVVCLCSIAAFYGCKSNKDNELVTVITNRAVIDLEANNSHWVYDNGAYRATFDIPELTLDAYNNGMVNCYAEFNTGSNNAYQELLPFIYFNQYTDAETGEVFNWSRLLDYDYTVGSLTIYYTNNDFNYIITGSDPETGSWHFRLVIIW